MSRTLTVSQLKKVLEHYHGDLQVLVWIPGIPVGIPISEAMMLNDACLLGTNGSTQDFVNFREVQPEAAIHVDFKPETT